ncbi:hypothetical protein N1851_000276 [Merluccius polli]|uniref:Uncharacterized protein n=1 Tax=Merluccius polli TaxID=89951 RepID=A0AA47PBZ5_MERPO|nr:hypothetical protein N1851_000276 [Merluccius polli]
MSATKPKRPRYDSQKNYDKARNKTRICLGDAFERWNLLKQEKNFKTHAEVARFLLNRIDWFDGDGVSDDEEINADDSQDEDYVPGLCIRMGGALKAPPCLDSLPVIDASETVHDIPDIEPPSVDLPPHQQPLHDKLTVLTEDDLIGKRASITYEHCLKQLATFLVLPIQKCPYICSVNQVECIPPLKFP